MRGIELKISELREKFYIKLDRKTNWGKEQVKKLFDDTLAELYGE